MMTSFMNHTLCFTLWTQTLQYIFHYILLQESWVSIPFFLPNIIVLIDCCYYHKENVMPKLWTSMSWFSDFVKQILLVFICFINSKMAIEISLTVRNFLARDLVTYACYSRSIYACCVDCLACIHTQTLTLAECRKSTNFTMLHDFYDTYLNQQEVTFTRRAPILIGSHWQQFYRSFYPPFYGML